MCAPDMYVFRFSLKAFEVQLHDVIAYIERL